MIRPVLISASVGIAASVAVLGLGSVAPTDGQVYYAILALTPPLFVATFCAPAEWLLEHPHLLRSAWIATNIALFALIGCWLHLARRSGPALRFGVPPIVWACLVATLPMATRHCL